MNEMNENNEKNENRKPTTTDTADTKANEHESQEPEIVYVPEEDKLGEDDRFKDGVGLFSCGNCKWLKQAVKSGDPNCSDYGVAATDRPCVWEKDSPSKHFEALSFGDLPVAIANNMAEDECLLMIRLLEDRLSQIQVEKNSPWKTGDRVRFVHQNKLVKGVVHKVTRTHCHVTADGDKEPGILKLRHGSLLPLEEEK